MGDENSKRPRTLGDYSRPSYKGYQNAIKLFEGAKVSPLRSDTIRLVQNICAFQGLMSEDAIQHLKDFLIIVDSINLNGDIRNTTRLRLLCFSFRNQAIKWLDRLPAGSISTWDDLTTRFLAQFFPPGRTAKFQKDILMFQQHQDESLCDAWTRFKDLLRKVPHHACGRLIKLRSKEAWKTIEDLAQYEEGEWNDPTFSKKGSPDYIDATLEQKLESIECRVESLMRNEVLLEYESVERASQIVRDAVSSTSVTTSERGDGVASIKRRRHDLQSDDVNTLVTLSDPRVQNEKIYNYAKNVMVMESHVIGDAVVKGKQHRASCKSKPVSTVSQPLQRILVGYSGISKAFRVFNSRTRNVQETLHINFLENQPNVAKSGPKWLFDIDTLTQSMNYQPVVAGNQPNPSAGIQGNFDAFKVMKEAISAQQYVLPPLWSTGSQNPHNTDDDAAFDAKDNENEVRVSPSSSDKPKKHDDKAKKKLKERAMVNAASAPVTAVRPNPTNSTNSFNYASPSDIVVSLTFEIDGKSLFMDLSQYFDDSDMPELEDIIYSDDEEDVGAEVDFSNLATSITVSPIPTTRVHKDHPVTQIIGDLSTAPQTRSMARMVKEQASTPINTKKPLLKDPDNKDVDVHI
nr:hypothetical protein [Tanacetum cinerariifolium]